MAAIPGAAASLSRSERSTDTIQGHRCRETMAHLKSSRPDSSLDLSMISKKSLTDVSSTSLLTWDLREGSDRYFKMPVSVPHVDGFRRVAVQIKDVKEAI